MTAPSPAPAARITEQLPGGGVAILDVVTEPTPRERNEWGAIYARLLRPRRDQQSHQRDEPPPEGRAGA